METIRFLTSLFFVDRSKKLGKIKMTFLEKELLIVAVVRLITRHMGIVMPLSSGDEHSVDLNIFVLFYFFSYSRRYIAVLQCSPK